VSFYRVMPPDVTWCCAEQAALGLLGQAGVAAVRVADLASPARRGLGEDGRTALTAAGAGRIRAGDLVVWLKPVAVTSAVVRRDGRVQAAGHPPDHVRLGVAEERFWLPIFVDAGMYEGRLALSAPESQRRPLRDADRR
jgi:hypothetical protein